MIGVISILNSYHLPFISSILQNLLNFTYKLRPPPDRQWGAKRADGSWTGIIGELDEKRGR